MRNPACTTAVALMVACLYTSSALAQNTPNTPYAHWDDAKIRAHLTTLYQHCRAQGNTYSYLAYSEGNAGTGTHTPYLTLRHIAAHPDGTKRIYRTSLQPNAKENTWEEETLTEIDRNLYKKSYDICFDPARIEEGTLSLRLAKRETIETLPRHLSCPDGNDCSIAQEAPQDMLVLVTTSGQGLGTSSSSIGFDPHTGVILEKGSSMLAKRDRTQHYRIVFAPSPKAL